MVKNSNSNLIVAGNGATETTPTGYPKDTIAGRGFSIPKTPYIPYREVGERAQYPCMLRMIFMYLLYLTRNVLHINRCIIIYDKIYYVTLCPKGQKVSHSHVY